MRQMLTFSLQGPGVADGTLLLLFGVVILGRVPQGWVRELHPQALACAPLSVSKRLGGLEAKDPTL